MTTPRHLLQHNTSPLFFATKKQFTLLNFNTFKSLHKIPVSQLFGAVISTGNIFFRKLAALDGRSISKSYFEMAGFRRATVFVTALSCFLSKILLLAAFKLKLWIVLFVDDISLVVSSICSHNLIVWYFSSFIFDQNALPMFRVGFFSWIIDHVVITPDLWRLTIWK